MKPHLDEAWRALRLAERDIQALDVLKESHVHLSIIGFHAHQAVEKSLKAVLFTRKIEFRRTHNLADLASLLREDGLIGPLSDDQLLRLNPYAVTFRYDDMDIALLTSAEAMEWALAMHGWAAHQAGIADETVDGASDL